MEELEGIDPKDIAELEARALKIVEDAHTFYEIGFVVSHDAAQDLLNKYSMASEGEIMAIFDLMTIIHTIAKAVDIAMNSPYEEED